MEKERVMQMKNRKTSGLLFRFTVIFVIFTILMLLMSAILTYANRMKAYRQQQEDRLWILTSTLAKILENDAEEFWNLQEYFSSGHEKVLVPYGFDGNYIPDKQKFYALFNTKYPDMTLGKDIAFEELSEDVRQAFAIYKYEYYLSVFENFQEAFDVEYVYYLFPTGNGNEMIYIYEGERNERIIDGMSYMDFQFAVDVDPKLYPRLWEAWRTGKSPDGFDYYNNEHGVTYGGYTPLVWHGKPIGIVGADLSVASYNSGIIHTVASQMLGMAAVMVVCLTVMLMFINRQYIRKLTLLEQKVSEYADTNDVKIAREIEEISGGDHEISSLAWQISVMILKIEEYITNLFAATRELSTTREHAKLMNKMAHRDALTGVSNRAAYESEAEKLEWEISNGTAKFAIAMIDLNFLKRINDTFGHEKGNVAIKKLCGMVCRIFEHSSVFRIGGDEFVVILKEEDLEREKELTAQFREELKSLQEDGSLEPWEKVSAAIGVARYDPQKDGSASNVFSRADRLMYEDKKRMKAVRE